MKADACRSLLHWPNPFLAKSDTQPFNRGEQQRRATFARFCQGRAAVVCASSPTLGTTTHTTMNALLPELQALEVELHHPGARCSSERVEQLLHPEFHEVGRSGRTYNRKAIVRYLAEQQTHPVVASDSFTAQELSAGAALLTYRSAPVGADGKLANHTLRSSVRLKTAAGWQLRYHQGTPAQEAW